MANFHDFKLTSIEGDEVDFATYAGRVSLVVNVASKCGLTNHYEGLQKLHSDNADDGFQVLGFPCNQFGAQEPGTNAEILEFAKSRYGAEFPLFDKIDVNGPSEAPVYGFLKQGGDDIAWNFTKFLVGKDGAVLARFEPQVTPEEIAAQLGDFL